MLRKQPTVEELENLMYLEDYYSLLIDNITKEYDFPFKKLLSYDSDDFLRIFFQDEESSKGILDINKAFIEAKIPKNILMNNINKNLNLYGKIKTLPDDYSLEPLQKIAVYNRERDNFKHENILLKKGDLVEVVAKINICSDEEYNQETNAYSSIIDEDSTMLLVRTNEGYIYDMLYHELEFIDLNNKNKNILR